MHEKNWKFKEVPSAGSAIFALQLLKYAEKYYPEIAFGVALELLGGLRSYEVYNLTTEQVKVNKSTISVMLNANQIKQIKPLINAYDNELLVLCKRHVSNISSNSNDTTNTHSALFIDKNQSPMSANTYRKTLKRLKEEFVATIQNEFPLQAEILRNNSLRVIMLYTIFESGLRSDEIRNLTTYRGDSLLDAASKYLKHCNR